MTTILVVEDDEEILNSITDILELNEFDVLAAENGVHAVQIAEQNAPDLILSDITMPSMDGFELIKAIRAMPELSNTPFILMTARAERTYMRQGMELGADDYITKPFTHVELLAAVNARLNRQKIAEQTVALTVEQAKKKLAQLVTHELRTPLVSVSMTLEILSRQLGHLSQPQMQELLETLEAGNKRLSRVVDQIIMITQLEAGSLTPSVIAEIGRPVLLSSILMVAIDTGKKFSFHANDVFVQFEDMTTNAYVLCDKRALQHALSELVMNAVNFSVANGEVVVTLWEAEDKYWIRIVDQGQGMNPEQLENALKEFEQVNRSEQEQQGIGLGLPLAKRIIAAHSGKFYVESALGRGTTITVGLPIAQTSVP